MSEAEKDLILIIDDQPENIHLLGAILKDSYRISASTKSTDVQKLALELQPQLILLDILMPEMDGYSVCQLLKQNTETAHIPVVFVSAKHEISDEEKGFEVGAIDYITKPLSPAIVRARVKTHLALSNHNKELTNAVEERTKELNETRLKVIQRLGRAAEYRDNETGMHVIRMSHYSRLLALAISSDKTWADTILHAAPMHDVGKIGIPDAILLKPGKLNGDEWETMQKHTIFGAEIIGNDNTPLLIMARSIALTHHEKWNGKGYPHGLAGDKIPLESRIIAIADVFDALTSERPYKEAWSIEKATQYIGEESGNSFDPLLVNAFNKVLPDILQVKAKYFD